MHSVAVLSFENLSGDASQDYLADGMTDIFDYCAFQDWRTSCVISRTVCDAVPDNARKPLPEIARELGVEFVVEGSVLQIGNSVRIAAQLIDGARDQHLWAERFEVDSGEILAAVGSHRPGRGIRRSPESGPIKLNSPAAAYVEDFS